MVTQIWVSNYQSLIKPDYFRPLKLVQALGPITKLSSIDLSLPKIKQDFWLVEWGKPYQQSITKQFDILNVIVVSTDYRATRNVLKTESQKFVVFKKLWWIRKVVGTTEKVRRKRQT